MSMRIRGKRNGQGGFSLLELLVVVIIIAIILSVALPKYRDYLSNQSIAGLHTNIVAKFREAPPLSRVLRKPVIVAVDLDNEKAWLEVENGIYGTKVPGDPGGAEITAVADNVTPLTAGVARYKFNYWGTCDNDTAAPTEPSMTIHIGPNNAAYAATEPAGSFRSITIMQETGRVAKYEVGCFGSGTPWAGWSLCADL